MTGQTRTPRNPAATPAWRNLKQHYKKVADIHMRELFAADPDRATRLALEYEGLIVDYSKHRITDETLSLLLALAADMQIPRAICDLFEGHRVNTTEKRPALHTALRAPQKPDWPSNKYISDLVHNELAHMGQFVAALHDGTIKGHTGRSIETVVNIGIGGSDLGPRLATDALQSCRQNRLHVRFVANADPSEINSVLQECNPDTTLFIISSKSFTTQETLANAERAQQWLRSHGCNNFSGHFVAVTASPDAAQQYGIAPDRLFSIWDWVGGRYSVWSATGLPVAISIGMDNFRAFLGGAHAMDQHFYSAPLARNIPVILALLDIWYINFFNCPSLAVVPYAHGLKLLPRYLGQLIMESNGKSIRRDGGAARCHTSAVIWGDQGTNAQHAFMQLLHQGTHLTPVDLLAGLDCGGDTMGNLLLAHCLAQGKALMLGNDPEQGAHEPTCKSIPGNRPSTTNHYDRHTPATLGMLLALYEHRTYVQACLWNINAFDQWGVELGKTIAADILAELKGSKAGTEHDASTRQLIMRYIKSRRK